MILQLTLAYVPVNYSHVNEHVRFLKLALLIKAEICLLINSGIALFLHFQCIIVICNHDTYSEVTWVHFDRCNKNGDPCTCLCMCAQQNNRMLHIILYMTAYEHVKGAAALCILSQTMCAHREQTSNSPLGPVGSAQSTLTVPSSSRRPVETAMHSQTTLVWPPMSLFLLSICTELQYAIWACGTKILPEYCYCSYCNCWSGANTIYDALSVIIATRPHITQVIR